MKPGIFAVVSLALASPLLAQQVGDTVVVIAEQQADLKVDGQVVGTVERGASLTVEQVNDDAFFVKWDKRGWIDKEQVLSLDRALDYFTDAIKSTPTADNYRYRAEVWWAKGKYDVAIDDYNDAIRIDPKNAKAYFSRGWTRQAQEDYDKAIADYDQAIRIDPEFVIAYVSRGAAWKNRGEYDKAIEDFTEAIRLDPKLVAAYYDRGAVWCDNKRDYDKAVADFTEVIRLDPEHAAAYYCRGLAWQKKRYHNKAIENYTEAIRLNPKDAEAYFSRGWAWRDLARGRGRQISMPADTEEERENARRSNAETDAIYGKAISDFTEAIRLDPNDASYYHERGKSYSAVGEFARAEADWAKAKQLGYEP